MDLAVRTGVPFLLLTHLSKDGNALGRRFEGACRLVWKMTQPDPDGQPDRRKVWVDKSYAEKHPPLGMAIAAEGCAFDFNPPTAPEPERGGRPPEAREKARRFIRDALTAKNDRTGNDLAAVWEKAGGSRQTFWRAVDKKVEAGELIRDGGKGTGRQAVLHLIAAGPDADPDRPF
jgi:hypothetical protein